MKNIYLLIIVFLMSDYCYSQVACPGVPTVIYGGQTYNTVQIGNQCWLKENLNIGSMVIGAQNQTNNGVIEKYCYLNITANCSTNGGLYQWDEAMLYSASGVRVQGICPTSWHLPTNVELSELDTTVGSNSNSLKKVGQGVDTGVGTNISGFSALLSGFRLSGNGVFAGLGIGGDGYFWSSTEFDGAHSYVADISGNNKNIKHYSVVKDDGFSIRCVKDGQLLLQSPKTGDSWSIGSNQNITWTSSYISNIQIEYSTDNGTAWIIIAAYIPDSTKSFKWTVPNSASTICKIKLTDMADTSLKSISTGVFTIWGPTVALISPTGGENWKVGQVDSIKWTCSNLTNIKIEYSINDGINWTIIIPSTLAVKGSYNWKIPHSLSANCKVRISDPGIDIINSTGVGVFTISDPPCTGLETLVYGGQTYNTIQIGNQCWLKENLNIGTSINGLQQQKNNGIIEKYCYNNDTANCITNGGLYQWAEAVKYQNGATNTTLTNPVLTGNIQGICPSGWHIPTYAEFQALAATVNNDGNSLKVFGQGSGKGVGTNLSGFSAMFNGIRYSDGSFGLLGLYNFFVSSTEWDAANVNYIDLGIDSNYIYFGNNYKSYGRSVRCINETSFSENVKSEATAPTNFNLGQNYPNPWNPTTTIRYQLPTNSMISIIVFNALGIKMLTLVNEMKPAGSYEVTLNGKGLSSGVYYYQMKTENFVMTKKLILIK